MKPAQPDEPQLYSWDTSAGPCGVTDDRAVAVESVNKVLGASPMGTRATLQPVAMVWGSPVDYRPAGRRARAARVPGGVVWVGGW